MSLTLTYNAGTPVPVRLRAVTPDRLRERALAEIERLEIMQGNRRVPLGELFRVSGDPSDGRIDIEGDLSGVHEIGHAMAGGEIHVHGPAGRHVGSEMTGGTIRVEGDAGDWVGCEMKGGLIRVDGLGGSSCRSRLCRQPARHDRRHDPHRGQRGGSGRLLDAARAGGDRRIVRRGRRIRHDRGYHPRLRFLWRSSGPGCAGARSASSGPIRRGCSPPSAGPTSSGLSSCGSSRRAGTAGVSDAPGSVRRGTDALPW